MFTPLINAQTVTLMTEGTLESYRKAKRFKMDTEDDVKRNCFDWLPTELIEYIVKECLTDFRDYCSLARVNRKFKIILDRLWKGYAQKRLILHLHFVNI